MFLTFLIITYQRPSKVARLLSLFLDDKWEEDEIHEYEIVIADDHGQDDTLLVVSPVIKKLIDKGWQVRYAYRNVNLRGDKNLYYGYTRDSCGEYVWFLCDDDVIDPGTAINYIRAVKNFKPLVGLCGFTQGNKDQYGNFLGDDILVENNYPEAIDLLIKFPKTTAYLMRRLPSIDLDSVFERWDGTLFSWVGLSIYLLGLGFKGGILVYPPIVAKADNEYGRLNYSYRVFSRLFDVVKDSVELSGMPFKKIAPQLHNLHKSDELTLCINGLYSHYNPRSPIVYSNQVLKDESKFLSRSILSSLQRRERIFALFKLLICLLMRQFHLATAKFQLKP